MQKDHLSETVLLHMHNIFLLKDMKTIHSFEAPKVAIWGCAKMGIQFPAINDCPDFFLTLPIVSLLISL